MSFDYRFAVIGVLVLALACLFWFFLHDDSDGDDENDLVGKAAFIEGESLADRGGVIPSVDDLPVESSVGTDIVKDPVVSDVFIEPDQGYRLDGTVVDTERNPIEGVNVFWGEIPARWGSKTELLATSVQDGSFRIDSLPEGEIKIYADHSMYVAKLEIIQILASGDNRVEIVLLRGGALEGVVTLSGEPFPDVQIEVFRSKSNQVNGISDHHTTFTDQDGFYQFPALGVGVVSVRATSVDIHRDLNLSQTTEAEIAEDMITVVDFDLGKYSSTLQGSILHDFDEETEINIAVTYASEESSGRSRVALPDEDGFYIIDRLPAGDVNVAVGVGSQETSTVQMTPAVLKEMTVTTLDFDLSNWTASIEGIIFNNKVPAAATIKALIVTENGEEQFATTRTDENGQYRLANLIGGNVTFNVLSTSSRAFKFELADGQSLQKDLDLSHVGEIRCTLYGLPAGVLTTNILVLKGEVAIPETINAETMREFQQEVTASGVLRLDSAEPTKLDSIEPGTYTIVAIAVPTDLGSTDAYYENLLISIPQVVEIGGDTEDVEVDLQF